MPTDFKCGCRIVTDVISINERDKPHWSYRMKTYANVCGRRGSKQQKFQFMENKLLEMEKARMKMFVEDTDEAEEPEEPEVEFEEEVPYEELKAYLKTMTKQTEKNTISLRH